MSDFEYEYDNDDYLDNENNDDNIITEKKQSKKGDDTLDNDDNVNDYLDDEIDDNDEPDDIYEIDDSDNDEELDNNGNYNKDNFHYTELDKDDESRIQFIVKNANRITSNILTIYELTELIGVRGTQISQGSPIFTDVTGITDPMNMAKKEILDNKCPLSIKRYIGLDKYELWDPNIMIKPQF